MPQYQLRKWRHPVTHELRVYLNGLETTEAKVWFERGKRTGTALPPIYGIDIHAEQNEDLTKDVLEEIAEAFSEMDLFLNKTDWTRLTKAADW